MNYYFNIKKKWIAEVIVTFIGVSFLLNVNNDIELTSDIDYADTSSFDMSLYYDSNFTTNIDIEKANTFNFSLGCSVDREPTAQIDTTLFGAIPFGLEQINVKNKTNISCDIEVTRYRFIEPSEPLYVLPITNSNISASVLNALNIPLNTTFYILAGDISCNANVSSTSEFEILGLVVESYVFGIQISQTTPTNFNITVTNDFSATALFNFSYITPTSFVLELVYQPTTTIIANVELTWIKRFRDLSGMVFEDLDGLTFEDLMYN